MGMGQLERIEEMERKIILASAAVRELESALAQYRDCQRDIRALEAYLNSEERREDLAADEAGLLPASLRRGVLSEDGIYNLLEENDELRQSLQSLFGRAEDGTSAD
jgi:hypothetical protein